MSQFVLPQLLQALRKHAKLSQSELAQKLGVTPSAVHQAENPQHPIKEELFARYAASLGYATEVEALEQGVALLRFEERMQAKEKALAARKQTPRKRSPRSKAAAAAAAGSTPALT